MEGTQTLPVEVTNYKEWTKGNVFHISFNIDGRYFMKSTRAQFTDGFRKMVHETIETYLKRKEHIIKHNEEVDQKIAEQVKINPDSLLTSEEVRDALKETL